MNPSKRQWKNQRNRQYWRVFKFIFNPSVSHFKLFQCFIFVHKKKNNTDDRVAEPKTENSSFRNLGTEIIRFAAYVGVAIVDLIFRLLDIYSYWKKTIRHIKLLITYFHVFLVNEQNGSIPTVDTAEPKIWIKYKYCAYWVPIAKLITNNPWCVFNTYLTVKQKYHRLVTFLWQEAWKIFLENIVIHHKTGCSSAFEFFSPVMCFVIVSVAWFSIPNGTY